MLFLVDLHGYLFVDPLVGLDIAFDVLPVFVESAHQCLQALLFLLQN